MYQLQRKNWLQFTKTCTVVEMTSTKRVFVTVGTTQFDSLIKKVTSTEVLKVLKQLGCSDITLQIGNGVYEPVTTESSSIKVSFYRLKNSTADDIAGADLVISHAGAGSIIDCLGAGKHLLVVVNDELMGNHQTELAEKLSKADHLHFCTVSTLAHSLSSVDWSSIQPFPPGQPQKFVEHLDQMFGVTT